MPESEEKYPFLDNPSDEGTTSANGHRSSGEPADPAPSVDELHYDDESVGEKLRHATDEQLNGANFGIIQIDDDGVVQFFNAYESELSGVDPDDAEGNNFFTQVAPCTNNRLFRGRFKKGASWTRRFPTPTRTKCARRWSTSGSTETRPATTGSWSKSTDPGTAGSRRAEFGRRVGRTEFGGSSVRQFRDAPPGDIASSGPMPRSGVSCPLDPFGLPRRAEPAR